MTLKMTHTKSGEVVQIKLAGRITELEVKHLLRSRLWDEGRWLLDLSDLLSTDQAGIEALQELRARGVELVGAKPYVAMLLDRQGQQECSDIETLNEDQLRRSQ